MYRKLSFYSCLISLRHMLEALEAARHGQGVLQCVVDITNILKWIKGILGRLTRT